VLSTQCRAGAPGFARLACRSKAPRPLAMANELVVLAAWADLAGCAVVLGSRLAAWVAAETASRRATRGKVKEESTVRHGEPERSGARLCCPVPASAFIVVVGARAARSSIRDRDATLGSTHRDPRGFCLSIGQDHGTTIAFLSASSLPLGAGHDHCTLAVSVNGDKRLENAWPCTLGYSPAIVLGKRSSLSSSSSARDSPRPAFADLHFALWRNCSRRPRKYCALAPRERARHWAPPR